MIALLLTFIVGLSACSWETVHTEKYTTDQDGNTWERHYLIIPYQSPCTSKESCDKLHEGEQTYNMKTHTME